MMMSEEEEETATLAEPMTVEGAKQLAQSNIQSPGVMNISPVPPVIPTVSPAIMTSPHLVHPNMSGSIAPARSPIINPLSSPTVSHSLLIPAHMTSPISVLHPTLWTSATIGHEVDEMSDYPSTVDLQAIRVSIKEVILDFMNNLKYLAQ